MIEKLAKYFNLYLSIFVLFFVAVLSQQQLLQQQTKKHIVQTPAYKYLIFTNKCYQTFFVDFNWFNFQCLKMTASKAIGYGLVMGGALIKFPQIIKILTKRSVVGISFTSMILQVSANILATGYSLYKKNPFSLYGQNVFIGLQVFIIILLFIFLEKQNKATYVFFFCLMASIAYYFCEPSNLPAFIIQHSITVQTLLICGSRMTQVIETHRLKSVGSLAFITYGVTLLGNFARIGTIFVQASNDYKFLISMGFVTLINAYIVFQFYLYRNQPVKTTQKTE